MSKDLKADMKTVATTVIVFIIGFVLLIVAPLMYAVAVTSW